MRVKVANPKSGAGVNKPKTRYTKSGQINLAYQVFGEGEIDLVYIPGWVSNIDYMWEDPDLVRLMNRFAQFSRVILFDKRGTGLSDRDVGFATLDERMDDLTAVMEAAGSRRAALLGFSEGGNLSILFAASFPERVSHLILYCGFARRLWASDYPWAATPDRRDAFIESIEANWGNGAEVEWLAPSRMNDEAFTNRLATYLRYSASPGAAAQILRLNSQIDVREILPTISVPTLVLNRRDDTHVTLDDARFLSERIQDSKFVALPGRDHLPWVENQEPFLNEIELFLTGTKLEAVPERVLATILFTDIVNSTKLAATLGDDVWHRKLTEHNEIVRDALTQYRGREINTTGDGFVVAFETPARAIACALDVIERLKTVGLEVRSGVHIGECHKEGETLSGVAVHIAARVSDLANAGEVLVSQTVKDLVVGAGFDFNDRGDHQLKGIPDRWTLYAATIGEPA